jgi:hypothetical protein
MDLAQLAVSVATIGMSGVVSTVLTFRLTAQRESRRLRQRKLESVYRAFSGYAVQLAMHWLPISDAMAGRIAYNDALDMVIKSGTAQPRHFARLEVLVAIYFPDLRTYYDELVAIRERASSVISDHKETYQEIGPHPTAAVNAMREISLALDGLEERFRRAIRMEAAKLNKRA